MRAQREDLHAAMTTGTMCTRNQIIYSSIIYIYIAAYLKILFEFPRCLNLGVVMF